jgi:hypothetical protein
MSMVGNPLIYSNNPVYTDVGDGTTATFVLTWTPPTINSILVTVGGVVQLAGSDFTQSGTNVTFVTAPASGLNIIIAALALSGTATVPSGGSVIDSSFASPVTGTGSIVRGTSPTITTPTISSPTIATPTTTGLIDNQGGQIKFPATQSASTDPNTLDDYEEGTVTDTGIALTFTTPGTLAVTYSTREVSYTKIGNRCLVQGKILTSSFTLGTASGSLQITGALPFQSAKTTVIPIALDGGTWSSLVGPFYASVQASSNTLFIEHNNATNGQRTQITTANCPTGTNKYIYFNFQYEV